METSSRIVKNTTFLYLKMAASLFISLYTARVFLAVLGASDYGLYTLVAGVIFMFGFLQDTMSRATLRYLCYYKANNDIDGQKKVYNISVVLHVGIAFIIAVNLLLVADFLFSGFLNIDAERTDAARKVYYFMTASFAFTVMTVPYDAVLNANENMLYYSIVGIAESLLRLLLALWLPYVESDKLVFYAFFLTCITILSLVVRRVYCYKRYEECVLRPSLFDKVLARQMVTYAGWNFITSITSLLAFNSMPLLLNTFFSTIVNAAQGIAAQVNGVLTLFSTNMLKALNPTITKSGGIHDIQKLTRFSATGSKLSFLIMCFFSVPIIVECPYILSLWLVDVPEWTALFCVMLLIRSLLNQLVTVYAECVYASNDIRNYCIIKGILNILPIPLVYLSFSLGGAPYMLYVMLFVCWELLGGAVVVLFNKKMYGLVVGQYLKDVVAPCIATLVLEFAIGATIAIIMDETFARAAVNTVCVTLAFAACSYFFVLTTDEKVLVARQIASLKNKIGNHKKKSQ